MTGVVAATGGKTFFGRTAKLVGAAGAVSHSQRAVTQVGDFLLLLAFVLAAILVGVQCYRELIIADVWSWDAFGKIAQYVLVLLIASGYRALGVGQSDDGKSWSIVGLISLMDPPRPDAKATIDAAKALGINVKMVTGDDVAIGDQIAAQLDLGDHLLVASDVFKDDTKFGAVSAAVMD